MCPIESSEETHFLAIGGHCKRIVLKRQINSSLRVDGVLLTLVDGRTNLTKQTAETLRQSYGSVLKIYRSEIPVAIKAAEISAAGKGIYAYDNGRKVAQAYAEFSKEMQTTKENISKVRKNIQKTGGTANRAACPLE